MTLQLTEPIIEALVAKLNTGLAAALVTVNADVTDGLTLDASDLLILDYIPTPSELNHFPTIGVSEGPGDFEDDVGFGATGNYVLNIMIFVQNVDQQRLNTYLRRWRRAVAICALAGRQFGPAWGVTLDGFTPGPTLGRGEGPRDWMSYTTISIRCKSEEDA